MSTETATKKKIKLKRPPKYCNILYNNDKTSMEFVMGVLMGIFDYNEHDAEKMMLNIHTSMKGVVYINSQEVCTLKDDLIKSLRERYKEQHLKHEVTVYEEDGE